MKRFLISLIKTTIVSLIGAAAAFLLPLLILNRVITFELANEDLSFFYHNILLGHTTIIWIGTTLFSLGSHTLKNENMRIPLFWSCAYLPITYSLVRVVLQLP